MKSKSYPVVAVVTKYEQGVAITHLRLADKYQDIEVIGNDKIANHGFYFSIEDVELYSGYVSWFLRTFSESTKCIVDRYIMTRTAASYLSVNNDLTYPPQNKITVVNNHKTNRNKVDEPLFQSEHFKNMWVDIQLIQTAREIAMQWFESSYTDSNSSKNKDLKLNNDNYRKLAYGKRSSIRLGKKDISLGPIRIVNDAATELYTDAIVTSVSVCSFGSLTQRDAYLDGFKDIGELRAELKRCYNRDIRNTDTVTIIDFDVVDK